MATITLDVPDDVMAGLTEAAARWQRDVRDVAIDRLRESMTRARVGSSDAAELAARTRRVDEFRESLAAKGVLATGDIKRIVDEGRP